MYLLLLDVFLQLPPETLLAAMFTQRSIIHKDKVGVETIETGPLTQRVSHWLIGSEHLGHRVKVYIQNQSEKQVRDIYSRLMKPLSPVSHISSYKISVVVNDSPGCDANRVSLPQIVATKCFHCLTHIFCHTLRVYEQQKIEQMHNSHT